MSAYAGSQAFANISRGSESVNRSTGSLSFTYTLIKLIGVKKSIDLHIGLRYGQGLRGSFGLPTSWTFDLPYLDPHKSLTKDGRTYVIDPTWTDDLGYDSGLRYVNNHGIKLTPEGSRQPLPSGLPGFYEWRYQAVDGGSLYFDGAGKLVEMDDLHSNHIYFTYVNSGASPDTALLDTIQDSWGQICRFGYEGQNEIVIDAPDGGRTVMQLSQSGIVSIQDAMNQVTTFVYAASGTQPILDTIVYPHGLSARFTYQQIAYLDAANQTRHFPAVRDHYHLQDSSVLSHTSYTFGSQSGSATFTGFSAGYQMGTAEDTLMESNNTAYQYDTLIANYDVNDQLLSASRIFFNFLHLPVREINYTIAAGQVTPTYQTLYQYNVGSNLHARTTNYSLPSITQQYHLDQNGGLQLLRRSTATYDSQGSPLVRIDEMPQAGGRIDQLSSHTCTYVQTLWGGEMLRTELYHDKITKQKRLLTYDLTSDTKNVARIVTQYSNDGSAWQPWKQKDLSWDGQGRLTSETISYSAGRSPPVGTPDRYTHNLNYVFDGRSGQITTSIADGANNTHTTTHSTLIMNGPVVRKSLPMGQTEDLEYDRLGRLIRYTDPTGDVTTTQYIITTHNSSVKTTTSSGYVTSRTYCVRGKLIEISDNGVASGRILRRTKYDALARPIVRSNEAGLSTSFEYDALNRLTKISDWLGNVTTIVHDDVALTQTSYVNGQLRIATQHDPYGRVIRTTQYADTNDSAIDYNIVHDTVYSGLGLVIETTTQQQNIVDQSLKLLFTNVVTHDIEFAISSEVVKSAGSDLSSYDTMKRQYQYDIFGHMSSHSKTLTYAGGKSYEWQSPKSSYDNCGRLVMVEDQCGHVESYVYDQNGFVTSLIRHSDAKIQYVRDAIGRAIGITSTTGTVSKTYSQSGRLLEVNATGSSSGKMTYSYSLDGSLLQVSRSDGTVQKYTLDQIARVVSAEDALGGQQLTTYDHRGLIVRRSMDNEYLSYIYGTVNHTNNRLVGTSSASMSRELSYDGFGRLNQTITRQPDGKILLQNIYAYNSQGKIVKTEISSAVYSDKDDLNYTRSYSYDGFGHLIKDSIQYVSKKTRDVSYSYDGNSNIISRTVDGTTKNMVYNKIDQRVDGFTWDIDGRLTCDNEGRKYTYYANDKLQSVSVGSTTVTLSYTANDALSMMNSGSARELMYYDIGSVNATSSTVGNVTVNRSYLQEPGRRIAGLSKGANTQYFLDSEASTSLVMEGGNAAVTGYTAYGETVATPANNDQKPGPLFGFKQELTDPTSGLIYLRSRYYQPSCGTFITSDTACEENRYAYCEGDPTNLVDRDGTSAVGTAVGAVVGTVVALGVGVATGGAGAVLAAVPECIDACISGEVLAGTASGAAGNFSGDAASAAVDHRHFSAQEGLEDLVAGGAAGFVGTPVGGFAGSRAMASALSYGMSQRAIVSIGTSICAVAGGATGAFTDSAVMATMKGQRIFSEATAISTVTGAVVGFAGGLLHSGAYLGLANSKCIPVPLEASDLGLIQGADTRGENLGNALYVMAPQEEADEAYNRFKPEDQRLKPRDVLRLRPGQRPEEAGYDTIAAHGMGRTVFASVRYMMDDSEIGPNYVRPVKGKLFAQHIASLEAFRGTQGIKLISCFGAYSNAQAMATALDCDVYGSYEYVRPTSATTKWIRFRGSGGSHLD